MIQYISHQFAEQKMKWPTIEREASAIVYSLEKLRPIVIGTDITVYTDHKPLKHLFTSEMKNPRIQRWAIILGEYNCKIEYISGPKNVAADMMSRLSNTTEAGELVDNEHLDWKGGNANINIIDNGLEIQDEQQSDEELCPSDQHTIDIGALKKAQRNDQEIKQMIKEVKEETTTNGKFLIDDGLLYHVDRGTKTRPHTRKQLVLPPSFRKIVLGDAHGGYLGGHLGIEKTTDKILKSYFWPNMLKDIMHYVQTCETCNRKKLQKERRPMLDMPMPSAPMEIVGIDTCGPFPLSDNGNKYVCTIIDHFSGWPEAWAIPDKSANTIAKLLLENFIPRHGCPRTLISDQGTEYCNALLDIVNKEMGIGRIDTSSYHPQSNGKTERFHRCMNEMIQKQISEEQALWDQVLNPCLGAYRVSKNESTKHTPFFIMYGRDPILPVDTLLQPRPKYLGEDYVPTAFERLHEAYSQVVQNMQQSRDHNKTLIARTAQASDFKPGDLVYYFDPSVQPGDSNKFTLHWRNYYRIVSKLGQENYCIKNMHTNKSKIVHSENLRHRSDDDVWDRKYDTLRPPIRLGTRPEETPTRTQPLRAARLPASDQDWYNAVHNPFVPFFETGPNIEDQSDPEKAENIQVSPRTFSADPATGTGFAEPQHGPSMATGDHTVSSPPSPESGKHGQSSPPSERLQTPHRYNLRSRGPILSREPLEGHNSSDSPANSVRGKRSLDDSSCEQPADKRLREQIDADSLTIKPDSQTDVLTPSMYHDVKCTHRSVSSIWLPQVYNLVISALDAWCPRMI